jgi:putative polyhydroxyalkanoate system protein
MADISIVKPHDIDTAVLRERLEGLAADLKRKYGVRSRWDGDTCLLDGAGLKQGVVEMTGSEVKIEVTLGMMAKMLKGTIMKEIDSKLAKVLAP